MKVFEPMFFTVQIFVQNIIDFGCQKIFTTAQKYDIIIVATR